MRSSTGIVVVLLSACGGAAPRADGSAGTSTAAEPSAPAAPALQTAIPIGTDGAPLGYLQYLPAGYGDGEPPPLLIFTHGAGEAGDGSAEALDLVDDLGVPQLIAEGAWPDDHPFVVLSPQYGTEHAEGDCAFADDLAAFADFAIEQYDVDPARVYLTGISCGAIGIWDYFASHAADDVIAASVTVSGHGEWAFEEAGCELAAMPPMWALHGANDDVVPVVHIEGPIERIGECEGADPALLTLTVLPDEDHVTAIEATYDGSGGHDVYAWLLEHTDE
jgi:poly(3-hydroxybutyrate) depolymerase